jgi:hypothetical protein
MSLSSAIDRAVKAYADHTDAVISGDHTLDVSGLLNPFNQITNFAQQFNPAFFPQYTNGNGQAPVAPMEGAPATSGKKKRAYKQRDANAPKRPLTAYFRFLKEQRPIISSETPGGEGGKAGDISKIATERWKALTDDERTPYKQAYQHELAQYELDTKAYKEALASGAVKLGAEDAEGEDEDVATPTAGASRVVAKADDDEESSDDSSSSDENSDEEESDDEEHVPAKAPSPPPKKAPKSAKKAVTAAADPAPAPTTFSAFNPTGLAPVASTGQKRKADDEDGQKKKKKVGRPTKAVQEAAAAASQLVDESAELMKEKKEMKKEKKRKSEAAAAA